MDELGNDEFERDVCLAAEILGSSHCCAALGYLSNSDYLHGQWMNL